MSTAEAKYDYVCRHRDRDSGGAGWSSKTRGGGEGGKYCQMRGATAERQGFPLASGAHLYCAGDARVTTGRDWDVVACHRVSLNLQRSGGGRHWKHHVQQDQLPFVAMNGLHMPSYLQTVVATVACVLTTLGHPPLHTDPSPPSLHHCMLAAG